MLHFNQTKLTWVEGNAGRMRDEEGNVGDVGERMLGFPVVGKHVSTNREKTKTHERR